MSLVVKTGRHRLGRTSWALSEFQQLLTTESSCSSKSAIVVGSQDKINETGLTGGRGPLAAIRNGPDLEWQTDMAKSLPVLDDIGVRKKTRERRICPCFELYVPTLAGGVRIGI